MSKVNTERFIAKRLIAGNAHLSGYSKPVMLVSVISTALGIAVMLVSVFIAQGFQHQIRTKVIGFGSHIQVLPFMENVESGVESVAIDQPFYRKYRAYKSIKSMQPVAYKPGILQRMSKNEKGNREIEGVLFKGINKNYDFDFLKTNLKRGKLISFSNSASKEMMVSEKIARLLDVKIGDTLASVLISKTSGSEVKPAYRKFVLCGIYETGLEEFDSEYVFIDISHLQKANGWGINVVPDINDTLKNNHVEIHLNVVTDQPNYFIRINGKNYPYGSIRLPLSEGSFVVTASNDKSFSNCDSVRVQIKKGEIETENDNYYVKRFKLDNESYSVLTEKSNGTGSQYAGGFEINLNNWDDLYQTDQWLYKLIGPGFTTQTIVEQQSHIFNWLKLVDVNVTIIIGLMLLVAIINLISAILVLILERSKLIGLLKSLGANNFGIGKIFFYFTGNILVRGLFIGNFLALGIYFLQISTGVLKLNPETYFVSEVPLKFDVGGYLFINVLTIVVCLISFFIPVILVSKINPAKAIKIE